MSISEYYDVIVVGAGVEGSSTAYNLVKNGGGRVLLFWNRYIIEMDLVLLKECILYSF